MLMVRPQVKLFSATAGTAFEEATLALQDLEAAEGRAADLYASLGLEVTGPLARFAPKPPQRARIPVGIIIDRDQSRRQCTFRKWR